jgi:hypothetical protein
MKEHNYKAYGLGIQSTILFPELIVQEVFPEVKIYFKDNISFSLKKFEEANYGNLKIQYTDNKSIVFFDDKAILKVINGNEIIIDSKTNMHENFLRTLILSQGMGVLLQQRGYLVLHANSVKMDDAAVVFMGLSGNGKSTISLALNKKGYPLITDDILAIKLDNNDFQVFPSFPRIKVWEDMIKTLIKDTNNIHLIHPESKKFSYSTEKKFYSESISIKKIYILENGDKNEIINLNAQKSLLHLIENSYNFELFNNYDKSKNLFECANLIKKIPVCVLKTCHSINKINDLIRLVEEDVLN